MLAVKVVVIILIAFIPVSAWLTPDILGTERGKLVSYTNQAREKAGVLPLSQSQALSRAAYLKTNDMVNRHYFAHISPDKKSMIDFLADVDYSYWGAGENLALGFSSAERMFGAWENSASHYANLINPAFTDIGIALINGTYRGKNVTFAAQYFAVPFAGSYDIDRAALLPDESNIANESVRSLAISRDANGTPNVIISPPDGVTLDSPSYIDQYSFARQYKTGIIAAVLGVSSVYFGIVMLLVSSALILMVLIEIKKQHPKHIASALGLIILLVFMIIT